VGAVIPALVGRRGRGHTASPFPKAPTGRLPLTVVRLIAAATFVLIVIAVIAKTPAGSPSAGGMLTAILGIACRVTGALGAVMLLVGLIELAVLRHLIYRALHLSVPEARRDARLSEGDPNIKRQRRLRAQGGARS
jgi:type III secretory pathway component EscU